MGIIEIDKIKEEIAVLKLNRPEAANALSLAMLEEIKSSLTALSEDQSLRCLILTGAGNSFCAGADLKERAGMTDEETVNAVSFIRRTMSLIEQFPLPVIAAINGSAFGGGLELALSCDLRIAGESSRMGLTETSLGIIPGAGGTQRLPRMIPVETAKRLIYTAARLTAREAEKMGIVGETVPDDELMDYAVSVAMKIAANAPLALRAAKQAVNKGIETDLASGLEIEALAYYSTIRTNDRLEGLAAFKEKRKPVFKGK